MRLITSQHYIDDATVEAKRAAKDYVVMVSPALVIDGETYHNIIDGNHSHAAALADGVDPVIKIATEQDCDKIALIGSMGVDAYLEAAWHDGEYIDAVTRIPVF